MIVKEWVWGGSCEAVSRFSLTSNISGSFTRGMGRTLPRVTIQWRTATVAFEGTTDDNEWQVHAEEHQPMRLR